MLYLLNVLVVKYRFISNDLSFRVIGLHKKKALSIQFKKPSDRPVIHPDLDMFAEEEEINIRIVVLHEKVLILKSAVDSYEDINYHSIKIEKCVLKGYEL